MVGFLRLMAFAGGGVRIDVVDDELFGVAWIEAESHQVGQAGAGGLDAPQSFLAEVGFVGAHTAVRRAGRSPSRGTAGVGR